MSDNVSNIAEGTRTGGQVLADALKIHGVDTVFCVPAKVIWR